MPYQKLKFIALVLAFFPALSWSTPESMAVKLELDQIYQNVMTKLSSDAPASEKVSTLKQLDDKYVAVVDRMFESNRGAQKVFSTQEITSAYRLYSKIIPFLKLKADDAQFSTASCDEAWRLVAVPGSSQEMSGFVEPDANTAELLKKLCPQVR